MHVFAVEFGIYLVWHSKFIKILTMTYFEVIYVLPILSKKCIANIEIRCCHGYYYYTSTWRRHKKHDKFPLICDWMNVHNKPNYLNLYQLKLFSFLKNWFYTRDHANYFLKPTTKHFRYVLGNLLNQMRGQDVMVVICTY